MGKRPIPTTGRGSQRRTSGGPPRQLAGRRADQSPGRAFQQLRFVDPFELRADFPDQTPPQETTLPQLGASIPDFVLRRALLIATP